MTQDIVQRVLAHPRYRELVERRARTRLAFFLLMVVVYFGFILTLAFWSGALSAPLWAGATMTRGLVVAVLIEVSAVLMIGAYVYLSRKKHDPILADILRDVK
ncbi:MAG TPA: DUF485 domain-containing protein [Chiayiivirga sp.]|nr:DUF485 domain-containing protein [Chiayiivirga sp.]